MPELPQSCKDLLAEIPSPRRELAEKLARSQVRYLAQMAEGLGVDEYARFVKLTGLFGANWMEKFILCLIGQFAKIPLPDMVRFDVAEGPIYPLDIATYRYEREDETGDARVCLHFDTVEVRMEPRKSPVLDFGKGDDLHAIGCTRPVGPTPLEIFNMWLIETFLGYQREVIGTMREQGEANGVVEVKSVDDLMSEIERQSSHIHRKSLTGPGNKIITSSEVAVYLPLDRRVEVTYADNIEKVGVLADGKWDVYTDTYFPDKDLLIWRYAETTGHSGIAAILQWFGFGGTLSGRPNAVGGRIRYKNIVLKPQFFSLLRLP